MSAPDYRQVFETAYGSSFQATPYAYQCRLACGSQADSAHEATLRSGTDCQSQLIEIPTGLGKTAGVVLAWLWNRVLHPNETERAKWPRRLVYCLPMRTLVEQTRDNVQQWLCNLAKKFPTERLQWLADNSPIILMGGEYGGDWDVHPEKEAILIGTQDMLLSRALNRGYGMSRYRWPMHFGLLNNDALWVMDETQLMGVSVETSAQLEGLRSKAEWSPFGICPTWWMSATLDAAKLATVDHQEPEAGWNRVALSETEKTVDGVRERFEAKKPVTSAPFVLSATTKDDFDKRVAGLILQKHQENGLTLVVVNRVARARAIYRLLTKVKKGATQRPVALIHSRFRGPDRKRHQDLLTATGDRIVIATQAVEAGVDVSANVLITELAPWSSLVQRFGRCNRRGEQTNAEVVWIDIQPKDEKDDLALPYSTEELSHARQTLDGLTDAGPTSIMGLCGVEKMVIRPVLRRRDLLDLFDTTPDLCGQDLDVSRFIRDHEDNDVQLFWRALGEEGAASEGEPLKDDELCRVSIRDAGKFLKSDKVRAFVWDPLNKVWVETKRVRPGGVFLIEAASGGYAEAEGWTGEVTVKLTKCPKGSPRREAYDKDRLSFDRHWRELDLHTADVVKETATLASQLDLSPADSAMLRTAAQWHDLGKAHEVFQAMLCGEDATRRKTLWAKSANKDGQCRRGFRHELASALAWLLYGAKETPDRDLVAYIIAAHHGKVRLSIRALPDEKGPSENGERPFARGIWHDDQLLAVTLPSVPSEPLKLDLSFMLMGEHARGGDQQPSPSWLARMIALRDQLGPFRLAYWETVLRAADMRASAAAEKVPGQK